MSWMEQVNSQRGADGHVYLPWLRMTMSCLALVTTKLGGGGGGGTVYGDCLLLDSQINPYTLSNW